MCPVCAHTQSKIPKLAASAEEPEHQPYGSIYVNQGTRKRGGKPATTHTAEKTILKPCALDWNYHWNKEQPMKYGNSDLTDRSKEGLGKITPKVLEISAMQRRTWRGNHFKR